MIFNPVPTEQTTAATDLMLSLVSLAAAGMLWPHRAIDSMRWVIWTGTLLLLSLGSVLAAVAHGLLLQPVSEDRLWLLIYLFLALTVCGVCLAAVHELWGRGVAARLSPFLLVLALGFTLLAIRQGGAFLYFVLFEGVGMLFGLAVYLYLCCAGGRRDARWVAAGLAVTILAALVQSLELGAFELIYALNHNGVYHLIQIPGVLLIALGVRAAPAR